jgi:hypothetical protein
MQCPSRQTDRSFWRGYSSKNRLIRRRKKNNRLFHDKHRNTEKGHWHRNYFRIMQLPEAGRICRDSSVMGKRQPTGRTFLEKEQVNTAFRGQCQLVRVRHPPKQTMQGRF